MGRRLLWYASFTSILWDPILNTPARSGPPHQAFLQDMIESVQRRDTRLMIKGKSYTERLKNLSIFLPVKSRRTLLDLIFLYKCLNGFLNINLSTFIDSRDN